MAVFGEPAMKIKLTINVDITRLLILVVILAVI